MLHKIRSPGADEGQPEDISIASQRGESAEHGSDSAENLRREVHDDVQFN